MTDTNEVVLKFKSNGTSFAKQLAKVSEECGNLANSLSHLGEDSQEVSKVWNGIKEDAKETGDAVKKTTKEVEKSGNSAKKAEGFWSKLGRSFKRIFLYRAIRKIISEIGQSAKEGLENVYEWSSAVGSMDVSETKSNLDRLSSSSLYLKNALGSALASALQIVTPLIEWLANACASAFNWVSALVSALGGKSEYVFAKKNPFKEWKKDIGGATSKAKELRRVLLGFDEVNRLDMETPTSGGGGAGVDTSTNNMFDVGNVSPKMSGFVEDIKKNLAEIEAVASTFVLAIGTILALSGINVPLGIALMGVGALGLASNLALNWNTTNDSLRKTLTACTLTIGTFALALGGILTFSGANLPLGIALMVIGASSLATATALNWNKVKDNLNSSLGSMVASISVFSLVLGAVLCFSGVALPLGISLLALGGIGLVSVVAVDWNSLSKKVEDTMSKLGASLSKKWGEIKTNLSTKWDDIHKSASDKWNSIRDSIENIWNKITLKDVKIKTPHISWTYGSSLPASDWKAKVLDAIGLPTSLPKLSVSWYAKGGVFNQASLIGVGENGKEAVVPLENNTEWLDKIADRLSQNNDRPIIVNLDGKKFFEVMVNQNNSYVNSRGKSPLMV